MGDVIERCGLSRADSVRPVSTYSLGMRQRLGIAVALLGDPEFLILDEPTNGLDPAGIAWVRDLIHTEVAVGHTVVLASHLVSEVERVCDRLVVLHRGRVVRAGPMDEVWATLAVRHLLQVTGTAAAAWAALAAAGIDLAPVSLGDATTLVIRASHAELAPITVALGRAGIGITHLAPEVPTLEVLLQEVRRDG